MDALTALDIGLVEEIFLHPHSTPSHCYHPQTIVKMPKSYSLPHFHDYWQSQWKSQQQVSHYQCQLDYLRHLQRPS